MRALEYHSSLTELTELDNHVKYVAEWAKKNGIKTLIVVTADHGHAFDVCGTVDTQLFNNAPKDDRYESKRQIIGAYELAGFSEYEDTGGDGFPGKFDIRAVFVTGTNSNKDIFENYQANFTARVDTEGNSSQQAQV